MPATSIAMLLFLGSASFASLDAELDAATVLDPQQPSAALVERIEQRPSLGEAGVLGPGQIDKGKLPYQPSNAIFKDWVPYYTYYALREGSPQVIHPMALGRFLLLNAPGTAANEVIDAALSIAHELPNGGLAWYYPRHYRVARMLGERLKYSSISQGTIITGLTAMAAQGATDMSLARKAFDAMRWPFEKGGVNLADSAVLEMPSFAGPPEIILNGWIDALLHIRDYGELAGDPEATAFFKKNVSFLATILPGFDAPEAGLSRYSDLSPYRVKVTLADADDVKELQVLYRPKVANLPAIRIPLLPAKDADNVSIYDNHIMRQNGRDAFVWLSCSQLYETVIVGRSASMDVSLRAGVIDRKATVPGSTGEELSFKGEADGEYRTVTLSTSDGLICGYPTNFSKAGRYNAYHSYHVVGLLLVALSPQVSDAERRTLIKWSLKWKGDLERLSAEGLEFRPLESMLRDINANQAIATHTDLSKLLAEAEAAVR